MFTNQGTIDAVQKVVDSGDLDGLVDSARGARMALREAEPKR